MPDPVDVLFDGELSLPSDVDVPRASVQYAALTKQTGNDM
jgi:hypothetical protein